MTNNACNFPNPINLPHGGTGVSSLVAYAPVCGGTTSTGNLQSVASLGTAGQALTSNGTSALPTFQTLSSGGDLVLIQHQTASSSSSLIFNTGISTSGTYLFSLDGVTSSAGGGALKLVVSNNGGSTWASTGYYGGVVYSAYNTGSWSNSNSSAFFYVSSILDTAIKGTTGTLWLSNITIAKKSVLRGQVFSYNSNPFFSILAGETGITGVNAFKFLFSSGNITGGTVSLYRINQ
jgi:hypothetical protein